MKDSFIIYINNALKALFPDWILQKYQAFFFVSVFLSMLSQQWQPLEQPQLSPVPQLSHLPLEKLR